jgi:predicted secreted Zn-dependent protease
MNRLAALTAVVFLSALIAFAQPAEVIGKEINDRDVEWSDFTGPVDPTSRFGAWTDWRITYSFPAPTIRNEKAYVNVTTKLFLRHNSWVKSEKRSQRLLEHEQGHFRIGRLCAREIVSTINSTAFSRENYRKEINEIYWATINKYIEINTEYDRDTAHSNDLEGQSRWNKKLAELLKD